MSKKRNIVTRILTFLPFRKKLSLIRIGNLYNNDEIIIKNMFLALNEMI